MEGILLILLCACLSLYMLLPIDLFSRRLGRTGWLRFVTTFLLFYAQLIATEFALGLFTILTGTSLALLNLAISTGLLVVLVRKYGEAPLGTYWRTFKRLPASLKNLAVTDPLWFLLLVLAAGFVGWVVFLGLIFPATDWDGNSYHLTFIGNVMQHHHFFDVPTSLPWLTGYPKGGEFMQMWSVLLTDSDRLSDLAQVPFLILGVYSLYQIATTLGADKKHARFAATLFVFLPIVLNQLKTTYVDLMLATLFFAAIAMIIRKNLSRLDWLLTGIIFSLIISVKSTGVLFVIMLMPLLFWNAWQQFGKPWKSPKIYLQRLALLVGPMSFGLYWYFKNWIMYGSPLHPFGFKIAGHSIFPGKTFQEFAADAVTSTSLPDGKLQRIWYVWTEQKDWFGCMYNYDTNYAGLGPIWFIILIPAALLAAYYAFKKRSWIFFGISATVLAVFAAYPANYYSRYTMFITAIGIFGLGIVLTNISRLTGNVVKLLAVGLSVFVLFNNLTLCNFSPLVVKDQIKSIRRGSERGAIYGNIPGQAFVQTEAVVQPGDVVAYDSKPYFIYPLWEPDFSNDVIYVEAGTPEDWYRKLDEKSVDYILTTIYSKEGPWGRAKYQTIYKDEMYEVFKVN